MEYLIVGLGNPGDTYAKTRHNVGFMVLDDLSKRHGYHLTHSKWQAKVCSSHFADRSIMLVRPETYMNNSGVAVAGIALYHKVPSANIIVIHDDLDLAVGRIKIIAAGGPGGHKGVRSIIDCLNTQAFPRIKIGIGRPQPLVSGQDYVLSSFKPEELTIIIEQMALVEEGLCLIVKDGIEMAMNRLNAIK